LLRGQVLIVDFGRQRSGEAFQLRSRPEVKPVGISGGQCQSGEQEGFSVAHFTGIRIVIGTAGGSPVFALLAAQTFLAFLARAVP